MFATRTTRACSSAHGRGGLIAFLEESTWRGKVYSGGWKTAAGGEAAVCCVFAPSQVAALAQIVRLPELHTRMCAIGETTAAAVRGAGVSEVAVAVTPTPEGIAQAVRSVYPIGR